MMLALARRTGMSMRSRLIPFKQSYKRLGFSCLLYNIRSMRLMIDNKGSVTHMVDSELLDVGKKH